MKTILFLSASFFLYSCSLQESKNKACYSYGFLEIGNKNLHRGISKYINDNNINLKNCVITVTEYKNDSTYIISNLITDPFDYDPKPFAYSFVDGGLVVFRRDNNIFDTRQVRAGFLYEVNRKNIILSKRNLIYDPKFIYLNVSKKDEL